ncbi:MAG TPA: FecR domain-containing protein [Pseudomonas sp.]
MTHLPDRKAFQAAASWHVQFQIEPPTPAERHAWQEWLNSDPTHQAAWNQLEQLQRGLGALPANLTRQTLSEPRHRRDVLKLMLVIAGTGYVGWNIKQHTSLGNVWADYRTPVGRQQSIELADGSLIELNTDTAIDVLFDDQQRLIRLRAGEILVRTGKRGDTRPFFVETHQGRVQALGTRFSVRQLKATTLVGVLEDQVSLLPKEPVGNLLLLKAGESAEFDERRINTGRAYTSSDVAWVDGQLVALNMRLGDLMDELSRYRPGIMQCDEHAARLRVSGAFRLDAIDAVLANLQATLPIRVKYFTRYWVSVQRIV